MQKLTNKELQAMNVAALMMRAEEIRREIFLVRMKKFSTPEKNTALCRNLRKVLARTLTFLNDKEVYGDQN